MMMEEQLAEGRRELEECERVKRKVEDRLTEMEGFGGDGEIGLRSGNSVGEEYRGKEAEDTRRMWQMIHELYDG